MGQMTTPKPLIIIIWTCQEMMDWIGWMIMELIGSVDVIWWDFGSEVGQITADVCQTPTTNRFRTKTFPSVPCSQLVQGFLHQMFGIDSNL
jgi:hypothetical protein